MFKAQHEASYAAAKAERDARETAAEEERAKVAADAAKARADEEEALRRERGQLRRKYIACAPTSPSSDEVRL